MNMQLVEIQPRELKFLVEVNKPTICVVHLANITDHYVAFKVKTTSPKKYCVRPNVGIIKPESTCDFKVTMQAQKSAPSETLSKDKFLIQSVVVPFGTTEEDITPGMFLKDGEKFIEEAKLRVLLASAPNSPAAEPVNGVKRQEASYEIPPPKESHSHDLHPKGPHSPVLLKEPHSPILLSKEHSPVSLPKESHSPVLLPKEPHSPVVLPKESHSPVLPPTQPDSTLLLPVNGDSEQESPHEAPTQEDKLNSEVKKISFLDMKVEAMKDVNKMEESRSLKVMDILKASPAKHEEFYLHNDNESNGLKDVEEEKLKLTMEELKSKILSMDSKLVQAEDTIAKLKEEKSSAFREKEKLKQDLTTLSRTGGSRKVRVGFPPLFVCMVALIGLVMGFSFGA